ncbi:MAG: hypothetical protein Kow0062_02170 [Acidobacteriota bacterium]
MATRLGCLLALVAPLAAWAPGPASAGEINPLHVSSRLTMHIAASDAHLIRRPLGVPRLEVGGVPAEPVDAFCWDGRGVVAVPGEILIDVDVTANTGVIRARWSDRHGEWTYTQDVFVHPEHPSGIRIGASAEERDKLLNDPIVANAYLHGDTLAGQPVLPTVFAYLAAWGPALVTLDGEPLANPFGLPGPLWLGHVMVTEGVRGEDGTVRTVDGGIYSPARGAEGAHDPDDLEVHLVFHDERFPRTANVPPLFSFFYHVLFESVSIQISARDAPGRLVR